MGFVHTAKFEGTLLQPFTCAHCKYETIARVRTEGLGRAHSTLLGDRQAGRDDAVAEADREAKEHAAALVSVARCPVCQKQSESALSTLKREAVKKALFFAFLAAFLMWGLLITKAKAITSPLTELLTLGFGAIAAGFVFHSDSWRWREVSDRVEVLKPDQLQQLLERLPPELRSPRA